MNGSALPPPVIPPTKRTLILLDATGSMHKSIDACKKKIEEVCTRAVRILTEQGFDATLALQFATFRNYDQDAPYLLTCSSWEKNPENLKSFISRVQAGGGDFSRFGYEQNFDLIFFCFFQGGGRMRLSKLPFNMQI